eukprot:219527_1
MATVVRTDPWSVIKTVNSLLFDDNFAEDIKCIQKAFESTANDVISVLDNNWQENEAQNKTILYQLLLTVFKDNNTNIGNILQDFIVMAPDHTSTNKASTFNECTLRQMVYILITHVFHVLSSDITPYIQNKMIQYFVDNAINGHKFNTLKQNTFVSGLTSYLDDDKVPTEVLQIVHQTLSSFKDQSIFQCKICYRISVTTECKDTPSKSNNIRCRGCNCIVSTAKPSEEKEESSTQVIVEDLGNKIVKLFDSRSGKALDDEVFPELMALLQHDAEGLTKIKRDNYCARLKDKDYDMIVKSLIAFVSTIDCDNASCDHKPKLQCSCDRKFKEFMYALVLSINGLKSANNDSLLQKLALSTRTVATISTLFCDILPDKLKEDRTSFDSYIKEWVSFELYDFKCFHCGHLNRSILIDRMFEYAIRLSHCRLCHYKRGSKDEIAVDFNASQDDCKAPSPSDVITGYCGKLKPETHSELVSYKSGVSMRYTVLRPKYGSLVEELRLNAIRNISKEKWDDYLKEAIALHTQLEKDHTNAAFSSDNNVDYGISHGQLIGVSHLVVVLIYTRDFYYASDFSRAYWLWQNENLFCDNFYWFGRYLYEAVHFFGIPFHHIRFKIKPLHHGLTARMVYDSVAPSIHFPAATNDKGTAATKAGTQGSVVSYAPKYIEGIENTKCVSTSQWSGYGNPEWLFMGLSKLQIASIRWKDEDYTPYNHAMLYLEKLFTQTIFDQHHYNTMNNALYLPQTRNIALRLVLHATDEAAHPFTDLPNYIHTIFNHWCNHKRFITLETYATESQWMSRALKAFLIDPNKRTVITGNINKLFPHLISYRDVDKKVVRRHESDLKRTLSTVNDARVADPSKPREDVQIKPEVQDATVWDCNHCAYRNVPLMVGSLWRFYNKMCECALCGAHRYVEANDSKDDCPNYASYAPSEAKLQIDGMETKSDQIKHGFGGDAQCLIGVSHITHLSSQAFVHLLKHHIVDTINSPTKRQIINENKQQIIAYFRDNQIDGAAFDLMRKKKKELINNIISFCNNDRISKLKGSLSTFIQAILKFDLKTLSGNNDDEKAQDDVTYSQLLQHCPSMRRCSFIVQYFERLTANLTEDAEYPHDIRRVLLSLPGYGPVQLLNDIEHIVDHEPIDSMECECKESKNCIHFQRSRRDDNDQMFKDIETKRKLFNCHNGKDFVYISMLDRLHSTLKHSNDINHNKERNIKLIRDDIQSTKPRFSIGVFMQYHALDPLYQNLHQETTHNQSYNIASHQFRSDLDEVKEFMKTDNKILEWTAWKTDAKYGITKGDVLRVEHVLCINLYCNYSSLCTAFRKSYRKIDYEDTHSIIIRRHINDFYWFGRFLTNGVEFFGVPATNKQVIYSGITEKCLFDHFSAVYEMPTSTTWEYQVASKFAKETGIVLQLSPKFRTQVHFSRYIDVSKISNFKEEKERLFAGMVVMAITNIYAAFNRKVISYSEYVKCILYLERIIEQTIHTREEYNQSLITERTKSKWMKRQREYLMPLLHHQMHRNLVPYKDHWHDIGLNIDIQLIQPAKAVSEYVRELFEHFCDNKRRNYIDLSCIMFELDTMDQSLRDIFMVGNHINTLHIAAIFPNAKQVKNPNGEWIALPSLNAMFQMEGDQVDTPTSEMKAEPAAMEMTRNDGIIDMIDRWLAAYYKANGRNDYVEDGVGKFCLFCADEGFGDDDMETELDEEHPEDCLLTTFDEDFPMKTPITDPDERNVFIFGILCKYKEYDPSNAIAESASSHTAVHNAWTPTDSFFDTSDININELKGTYKEQCVSLWKSGLRTDNNLIKVIAIGYKHQIPYLSYLVDMYMRAKVSSLHFELTIASWALQNHYMQSVQKLSNETNEYYSMLVSAITEFCGSRLVPQINFHPTHRIRDSLSDTVKRLRSMFITVADCSYKNKFCPFQMDFMIIFKETVHIGIADEDDDDDDDEEDVDPYGGDDEKDSFWNTYNM